jgi:hypothetical protein
MALRLDHHSMNATRWEISLFASEIKKKKRYSCNMPWWLPHFLDNRLTDGGDVVSLTRQSRFARQEDPWLSFLLEDK